LFLLKYQRSEQCREYKNAHVRVQHHTPEMRRERDRQFLSRTASVLAFYDKEM